MPTLSWLTRDEDLKTAGRAPYRLLQEAPELGHGDPDTGNMLIQGDNLEALKSLLPFYAGQVKCIYIDPPYNTGSAFEHYDDSLEHSRWLAMMWPRLELLRELLSEDGSIWVSIDDNEGHYLKVVMDEVFGRKNFIGNAIWEKADSPRMDAVTFSYRHDNTLCFARDAEKLTWNRLTVDQAPAHYDKVDGEGRQYYLKPLRAMGGQGDSRAARPTLYYALTAPDGTEVFPVRQDGSDGAWRWRKEKTEEESDRIDWIQGRAGWTPYYRIYADSGSGRPAETIWRQDEVGSNRTSKAEIKALFPDNSPFGTPKPEGLLERIIHIGSNPGDLVLDSFLGSGTTAAVAQKMGRRYIGIEMGGHAVTHCQPRLTKVVDGERGGVSKARNWTGGGGFRFWRLGPPVFDDAGRLTADIVFNTLAAHVWFSEMNRPLDPEVKGPLLGVHGDRAVALLYNGVLGDKRPAGGNVLTRQTLAIIREGLPSDFDGDLIVYGERSALTPATLARERIAFRQTPYDVKARR
ncbi:MAG: site-specific DNA-methyltransferase [Brevundimonas sp.]|uniref:site-specific DNA-methyltransferase n=1 Tax=Brevundimonas sp. TaxID=1871086 RepID=UPI00263701D4|nr:site-specific DNA-methyltransferase [Brevundimonas sp.]MDI6625358.1 site-specific DNA-methyltransferase [Brevundimonas sp.]